MSDHLNREFGTMKTFFDDQGYEQLLKLSPEEKLFTYYTSMAAIVSYPICLFQMCPFPEIVNKIAEYLLTANRQSAIVEHLRMYWLYLFSNYGVHFLRAADNNKRVPSDLGLDSINALSLRALGIVLTDDEERYLFDKDYFPTRTIAKNIEQSGGHFYGKGMTTELYNTLPKQEQNEVNGYFEIREGAIYSAPYSTHSSCGKYLDNCISWFTEALAVAKVSPQYFDCHTVSSLEHLIRFYESGDEEDFKAHSREWLQMKNPRVEYTAGFIETYDDPMSHIGTYQSDVTIKSLNIDSLITLLPSFEEQLPFPREWKRKNMDVLPNAAVAHKVMAIGGLGPLCSVSAYCLPNYNDMRSELGSKQVMYQNPKSSNLDLYKQVYLDESQQNLYQQHSPDMKLEDMLSSLHTTLHETIGHGSGANVEGITNEIKAERIGKWEHALEEMRAEVLALYTGIFFLGEISKCGILEHWPKKMSKPLIAIEYLQIALDAGWKRWARIPADSMEVKQAHALADTGIMYYLIDHSNGAIVLREEVVMIDGKPLPVLRIMINDHMAVRPVIAELATLIQKLSSNAVFTDIDAFMQQYAVSTRNPRYSTIVKDMQDTVNEGVMMKIQIYPEWVDSNSDAHPQIPQDPIDACLRLWSLAQH